MRKNPLLFTCLFVMGAVLLGACSSNQSINNSVDPNVVAEITPFQIGRLSALVVRFAKTPQDESLDAFALSPQQKGAWNFRDERTAIFTPSEPYKAGSTFKLAVNCKKLFDDAENFTYTFSVDGPSYSVAFDALEINDGGTFTVRGSLSTDIPLLQTDVNNIISAEIKGASFSKKLSVAWDLIEKTSERDFTITSTEAHDEASTLTVRWNGKQLGLSTKDDAVFAGERVFRIPGANTFSVVDIDTSQERALKISFSDAVDSSQDVLSFIEVTKRNQNAGARITYSVNKNIVTLYNDENWQNVSRVAILAGLQSESGSVLEEARDVTLTTSWDIPAVRFSTSGNILPTSQGTTLALETKNLAGLSLRVFEIYDTNMLQFLQVNELNGDYRLEYVGEPVHTERVSFDWDDAMQNVYVPRGIDISNLVKKYPHGMFKIQIGFTREDIRYACRASHRDFSALPNPPDIADKDYTRDAQWEYLNKLSWDDRRTYWQFDDDPCHPAFYMESYGGHFANRNVLVSDIGIMAKRTESGDVHVTVTNLKSATPLKDASVVAYSKINREVAQAKSDTNGSVVFKDARNATVIVASANNQSSYLKLSDGAALSVSHFETGGEKIQSGAKGFIYGERGVWRPGDNMYLTFVLQDIDKKLPKNIPVTFELQDPLGRIADAQTVTNGVNGFYAITTKTSADSPTGLYLARVKLGGNEWTRNVRVETIVPNHLDVQLEMQQAYLTAANNDLTLSGKWLHGAPTPNYEADIALRVLPSITTFDGYSSYTFDNMLRAVDSTRETVWEGTLDASSKARVNLDMRSNSELPGKLRAQFITRIFEPSGMFSTQQTTFDYSPYSRYVGLRLPEGKGQRKILYTDEAQTAEVVLLTEDGKLAGNASLAYTIYKLGWRWWWEKDALSDATFVSSETRKSVAEGTVDIRGGKGSFNFTIKHSEWGRYLVVVEDARGGHATSQIVYVDWPDWSGRSTGGSSASASVVPLATDKETYTVGETASVSFTTGDDARALVTVEKGGEIIKQEWLETKKGTTVYKLALTDKMSPNVYVHVTLVQSHMQTANSLPIRLYGVVPLLVDNPATKLAPVITMPASYEPNKKSSLTISEQNGKPMTFTVAVVDEGLLGLTNFKAAQLRDEFYKKEASLLESWDVFGYVMNAYSGKLETLLSIGGSEDILDSSDKDASRFTPVVFYFGPYELKANGKQEITFDMPQYIGAVRAMVVAGSDGAYGTAEKSTPVKSDLMVLPTLPRTFGTNETIDVPVTVFNGTDKNQRVSVKLDASGAVNASETKAVTVSANGNAEAVFTVTTTHAGSATFNVTATASGAAAQSTTTVAVQARGMEVSYRNVFTVEPGKTYNARVQTPTDRMTAKLFAELSPFPSIDLSARLNYLLSYPHGCIEQITSGAFPQLYIADFMKLTPQQIDDTKQNVKSVIERYPNYQTAAGGMAYWQGGNDPNAWGSCYALHFLLAAKKLGYSVPESLSKPLISWIAQSAKNWTRTDYDTSDIQAYKLFVLAEAQQADIGSMNRLRGETMRDSAKLLLASAYARAGRASVAQELFNQVTDITTIGRMTGGSFRSPLRDAGIMLYASTIVGNTSVSARVAKRIADELSSGKWCSTQETAWALMSLLPYYNGQRSGTCAYTVSNQNGKASGTVNAGVAVENFAPADAAEQVVAIQNTGDRVLYGTLVSSGLSLPATEARENAGLVMSVTYFDSTGARIRPSAIKSGDSFRIAVSVTNSMSGTVENIALTVPVPTAWEFSNDRVGESESNSPRTPYTHQDIRDDAIYTYFDLKRGETFTYTFYATAVYKGAYYIPAIHARAMYDNDIRAVETGIKMEE
ncbi:MAG: alpha-2-macroglobulin [Treponema sp.]|nr:alpha-2-macroglobulin [Treponema sp.]